MKASSLRKITPHTSEQIYNKRIPRDNSSWQLFGLTLIHPSIFNTTPNHAARWHDRSVSSLSARTIYCSQTASDRKTTNKYYLLPYGTIKHCKCMQSFFSPFFTFTYTKHLHFFLFLTRRTTIFYFYLRTPCFSL